MKITIKFFISFGLISWFLLSADCEIIAKTLWGLSPLTLISVTIIYFSAIIVNSIKWRQLLPHYSLKTLFSYTLIAQYYSVILPGQMAGEIVKTYKLGKGKKDAETIAASVVVDKLTAFIGLLLVGVTGLILSDSSRASSFAPILIGSLLILLLSLFCLRVKVFDHIVRLLLKKIADNLPFLKNVTGQIENLLTAWQVYLYRPALLFASIFLGVVFQSLAIFITIILSNNMGISLSFKDWCWIYSLVSIAVIIPVTIGSGTGIRESCFVIILSWFNISKEKSLALSFSIFGIMLIGALVGAFLDWVVIRSKNDD